MCKNENQNWIDEVIGDVRLINNGDLYSQHSISTEQNSYSMSSIMNAYNEYKEESIYW